MTASLYYDEYVSPIGTLLLISDGDQIVRIDYGALREIENTIQKWAGTYFGTVEMTHEPERFSHVKQQLKEYFNKERQEFTFDFSFYGTAFQKKVWNALFQEIPYGITKSYKDIAITIGNPKAVRAVGGAVNKNPFSIVVPCHRVIGMNGKLVGYNGGLGKKEYLLKHEEIGL